MLIHTAVQIGLPAAARESGAVLTGSARESFTGKPIPNARVQCGDLVALTDERGEFLLENAPIGEAQVLISAYGYAPVLLRTRVSAGRTARLEARLKRERRLAPVRAAASRLEAPPRAAGSAFTLSKERMLREVGAAWDVQRAAGYLPGAAQSSDTTNHLIVRGGDPSENLIRVDHIQMPSASHLSWQGETGGAIGLLNMDFVRHADVYTGGFPARFGGKLSSALDIRFREGNRRRLAGAAELSIGGAGGGLEGPLPGGNGSWAASTRRSFLRWLQEPTRLTSVPDYEDVHAKVAADAGSAGRIVFTGIAGRSGADLRWVRNADRAAYEGSQTAAGITWSGALSDNGAYRATLSRTVQNYHLDVWQPKEALVYENRSTEREAALEAAADLGESHREGWQTGVEARHVRFRHRIESEPWQGYSENHGRIVWLGGQRLDAVHQGWKLSAFASRSQPIGEAAALRVGARAFRFTTTGAGGIAPRASVRWELPDGAALTFSATRHFQPPSYIEMTLHERNLSLQNGRADHLIAGYQRRWSGSRLLIEAYNKRYWNLPAPSNNQTADPLSGPTGEMTNSGQKRARGVDILLEARRGGDGPSGNIMLSLTRSKARDSASDPWHDADFDFRRVFSAAGEVPLRGAWRLSGKWRFVGGRPFTDFPIERLPDGSYAPVPDLRLRNQSRYPDYHRLDLRIDRRFDAGGWGASLFLEVQNLYNRDNVFARHFDALRGEFQDAMQFRRLALIGAIADF